MNKKSDTYKNLLIALTSIIVFSLIAEGATRIFNLDLRNSRDKYLSAHDRFFFHVPINKKDPYLLWRLKPQAHFGKISINSKGIRGPEISEEKKHDVIRIITLGDSCTMGVGINNDETYAAVLKRILKDNSQSEKNYEVINAGVAGYSSFQGLRYLKSELIKYKPDIITVQFGFNDYLYTGGPSDKNTPQTSPLSIYLDEIMNKSRFYRFIKDRIRLLTIKKTSYPPDRRVDIPDFKENLKGIISIANEAGIKVVLLNLPVRPDIPLVVNPIPIPIDSKEGKVVEWLRPAIIGGKSYFVESNFEGPVSVLEESIKKYPQWALAHYFLARKYESSGQKEKAEEEFKKARETDIDRKVLAEYNIAIKEIAGEMNIPMVNLVSVFESRKGDNLFLDERHLSASAHMIIAEEVRNTLKMNSLIE